jgi:hypothetical protein
MTVQKETMRHASIPITLNTYCEGDGKLNSRSSWERREQVMARVDGC